MFIVLKNLFVLLSLLFCLIQTNKNATVRFNFITKILTIKTMKSIKKHTKLLCLLFLVAFFQNVVAQEVQPKRSTLSMGGASQLYSNGENSYYILQSVGQFGTIGSIKSSNIVLRQGFVQAMALENQLQEQENQLHAEIFPNPVQNNLSIAFGEMMTSPIQVSLYDMTGRTLVVKDFEPNAQISLDISNLTAGNYLLKIVSGNKKNTLNVFKK